MPVEGTQVHGIAVQIGEVRSALHDLVLRLDDHVRVESNGLHRDGHGLRRVSARARRIRRSLGVDGHAELLNVLDVDDAADEAGMDLVGGDAGAAGNLKSRRLRPASRCRSVG